MTTMNRERPVGYIEDPFEGDEPKEDADFEFDLSLLPRSEDAKKDAAIREAAINAYKERIEVCRKLNQEREEKRKRGYYSEFNNPIEEEDIYSSASSDALRAARDSAMGYDLRLVADKIDTDEESLRQKPKTILETKSGYGYGSGRDIANESPNQLAVIVGREILKEKLEHSDELELGQRLWEEVADILELVLERKMDGESETEANFNVEEIMRMHDSGGTAIFEKKLIISFPGHSQKIQISYEWHSKGDISEFSIGLINSESDDFLGMFPTANRERLSARRGRGLGAPHEKMGFVETWHASPHENAEPRYDGAFGLLRDNGSDYSLKGTGPTFHAEYGDSTSDEQITVGLERMAAIHEFMLGKREDFPDEAFEFSEKLISEDAIERTKKEIIERLEVGDIKSLADMDDRLTFSTELLRSAEIKQIALRVALSKLRAPENGSPIYFKDLEAAHEISTLFEFDDELIKSAAKNAMISAISNENIYNAFSIKRFFEIDDSEILEDEMQDIVKKLVIDEINDGNFLILVNAIELPDEILYSEEVQRELIARVLEEINTGQLQKALDIKDALSTPDGVFKSPEVMEAGKALFLQSIKAGSALSALQFKKIFELSDDVISTPEIQDEIVEFVLEKIKNGKILEFIWQSTIPEFILLLPKISEAVNQKMLEHIEDFDLNTAIKLKDAFNLSGESIERAELAIGIFGPHTPRVLVNAITELLDGKIHDEFSMLGITKTGEAGINQLKAEIRNLYHRILTGEETKLFETSAVAKILLAEVANLEESTWGSHGEDVLMTMITEHNKADTDPAGEEYLDDNTYELYQKGKKDKPETIEWNEDEAERYLRLREQLQSAVRILDEGTKPFTKALESIEEHITEKIDGLEATVEKLSKLDGKERAIEKITQQIEALKKINLRSLESFEENFVELAQDKKLHDKISAIMFAWALRRPPGGRDLDTYNEKLAIMRELPQRPSVEALSFVVNQIDHVTNQEVFGTYFTTKEAGNEFSDMTSVKALENALARVQGEQKKTGIVPITFDATRGILMEFSGHIADSCWANKYPSIAESFPNFTSVMIRQHPGEKHEKLVGSFMLIESESVDGEPLLIIRGLNPRENFINNVDVEDFFEFVTQYVKGVADKLERRPAIVIDDHSGGSGTNRPVLFGYMKGISHSLDAVSPDRPSTDFNGYNISRDTYTLE